MKFWQGKRTNIDKLKKKDVKKTALVLYAITIRFMEKISRCSHNLVFRFLYIRHLFS